MSKRNKIYKDQNAPRQLQQLGAQRMLYRRAKSALVIRAWLSVIILLTGLIFLAKQDFKWIAAVAGLVIFAVDFFFLSRREKTFRLAGARVQEAFDCSIYRMQWSRIAGTPEPPESEIRENRAYQKIASKFTPLKDWYCVPDHVDHWTAVALCQRSNIQWDTRQRTRYVAALKGLLVVLWSVFAIFGLASNPHFRDIAPLALALLPISKLLLDQIREHHDVLAKQERLKFSAETLLMAAASDTKQTKLPELARQLQDDIFDYRARGPLVLDWIFYKFRKGQQEEMELAVLQLVEQLEAKQDPTFANLANGENPSA